MMLKIGELTCKSEHERYLVESILKTVIGYPAAIKAFYMRLNNGCEPGKKLLLRWISWLLALEKIVGGSQREERLENLEQRMKAMHIPAEEMSWYLDTRRFGTVPHAGFGLGFERMVQFIYRHDEYSRCDRIRPNTKELRVLADAICFDIWHLDPIFAAPKGGKAGAVAQSVEQRTENPCVAGSIPAHTTMQPRQFMWGCFLWSYSKWNS